MKGLDKKRRRTKHVEVEGEISSLKNTLRRKTRPTQQQFHFHYSQQEHQGQKFYQPQSLHLLGDRQKIQQGRKSMAKPTGGRATSDLSQGSCDNAPATPDSLDSLMGSDEEGRGQSSVLSPSSDSNAAELLINLGQQDESPLLGSPIPTVSPLPLADSGLGTGMDPRAGSSGNLSQKDNLIEEVTTTVPSGQNFRSASSTPTSGSAEDASGETCEATVISIPIAKKPEASRFPVPAMSSSSCISSSASNVTLTLCAPSSSTTPICNTPKSASSAQSLAPDLSSLLDSEIAREAGQEDVGILKPEFATHKPEVKTRRPRDPPKYEDPPPPVRGLYVATDPGGGASSVINVSKSHSFENHRPIKPSPQTPRGMEDPCPQVHPLPHYPPQQQQTVMQPILVYQEPLAIDTTSPSVRRQASQTPGSNIRSSEIYASLTKLNRIPHGGTVMLVSYDSSGKLYR